MFIEREGSGKGSHRQGDENGEKTGEEGEEKDADTHSACKVDKLFEGKRAKDLILNLDKLGNLVTHGAIITEALGQRFAVWVGAAWVAVVGSIKTHLFNWGI